jgi:hypothetical protein
VFRTTQGNQYTYTASLKQDIPKSLPGQGEAVKKNSFSAGQALKERSKIKNPQILGGL